MSKLLEKFSRKLWSNPQQQQEFISALTDPQPLHPCILWLKKGASLSPFAPLSPLPWQLPFIDRLGLNERPGKHPLHQQGAYYCLDFSSVFAASVLTNIDHEPKIVIDLCAAPGGKSILAWKILQPNLLLSNEVIGKRVGLLIDNLRRCRIHPVKVFSADTKVLADNVPLWADVVLVDAPCTGQSLLAKGGKAPGCFHPVSIKHNVKRQKRILGNAAQLVAPGGYLVYMTCAFSKAENESVCAWLTRRFPQFVPQAVPLLKDFQSHLTDMPCYRMWPQSRLGAGAFTAIFQSGQDRLSRHPDPGAWLEQGCRWDSERDLR
ncbi:RsmB/NOP family class I SAM-dependent RNA methyltransferase [Acaryochloris sp. IP29b_bin.137]|uniref:RsmB/NOP family class I SAM-dependent RNA methyltransferase n=1 Tax=Acaryochloris sp. IP29b_bin.137 TaxID=2969217 RepID=UPI00260CDD56|nr:RsmB/NOP family class I SAM-dependent RNA methyltransferase [Acaryochloris sp. IP29b_bin.137]